MGVLFSNHPSSDVDTIHSSGIPDRIEIQGQGERTVISDIRERIRILFINTQEQLPIQRMGLPPYREWIANVMRLSTEQISVIHVADGESLPQTIEAHGVIGGGSSHSVFEDVLWIQQTKAFFNEIQARAIPELHLCWSHQAKAESEGGVAVRGKKGRRFGIEQLQLTSAGQRDPLFRGLPAEFHLFTSHTDVVERKPPSSSSLNVIELAKSGHYDNEVLAYGATVRTIQAHPELTAEIITPLADQRRKALVQEGHVGATLEEYLAYIESFSQQDEHIRKTSQKILCNWMQYFVAPYYEHGPVLLTSTKGNRQFS